MNGMILVAGGTGTLGTRLVPLLRAGGEPIRVLTRDPARAGHLLRDGVEVATGDVRDPGSLSRAMDGVSTVVSAVHGFVDSKKTSPEAVDWLGNRNLVQAAKKAGAGHVVMLSALGAAPDHPMSLYRMKHRAEEELKASGLAWTIIRASAFMEMWAKMVAEPLLKAGKTTIFGRGRNPINFVSTDDVARFVDLAITDPSLRGQTVDVGGPENLTFRQVVEIAQRETGARGTVRHVPLPMMRALSVLMKPVNPGFARQVQAGVVMDTRDMSFDGAERGRRFPSIPLTTYAEVVRRDFSRRTR
jgi:NADH dehydrogenase